jgi:hypothetical protein
MKQKHGMGNVYTPGWAMRLFVLAVGFLMAGMHAFILRGEAFSGVDGFPILFLGLLLLVDAFFLWYALLFTTQTRVIVSAEGIELQRGASRLFTAWDNASHFGVKGAGKSQERGLYLHHKVQPDVTGLAEKLFYGWATDFIPLGQVINLPTTWGFFQQPVNLEKLAQTEFGQDVAYHAPHLLEAYAEYEKSKVDNRLHLNTDSSYVVGSDSRTMRKEKRE